MFYGWDPFSSVKLLSLLLMMLSQNDVVNWRTHLGNTSIIMYDMNVNASNMWPTIHVAYQMYRDRHINIMHSNKRRKKEKKIKDNKMSTYVVSSLRKYEILSPHRLHPMAESFASIVEYINGRIPSLYRLPDFTKLTIDSLSVGNSKEITKVISVCMATMVALTNIPDKRCNGQHESFPNCCGNTIGNLLLWPVAAEWSST